MSIWGGCAGGGGGEEARAYSYANGCGEGCKAQEPSSPPEKVGALSPAHSWGLAGLERIRTHIGKASSSPSPVLLARSGSSDLTSYHILFLVRVTLQREARSGEASGAAQALPAVASLSNRVPVVEMQASQRLQGPPASGALSASRGNWDLMSPAPPGAADPDGEVAPTLGILQFPRGPRATPTLRVSATWDPALAASTMDRAREGSVSAWPQGG